MIATGMLVQAKGAFPIMPTRGFWPWAGRAALLGLGTALVCPTLLAAIGDLARPNWRASAVGVYRPWRDVARYSPPAEDVDAAYPLMLTTGRVISHFLSGSQTRRVGPLIDRAPAPYVELAVGDTGIT